MTEEKTPAPWLWYAGNNEEYYSIGPCATRQSAIDEAIDSGICEVEDHSNPEAWSHEVFVIEARKDPLLLADFIDAGGILEDAEDCAYDDFSHPDTNGDCLFEVTKDQISDLSARLKAAATEWQVKHDLTFMPQVFTATRNAEVVSVPTSAPAESN